MFSAWEKGYRRILVFILKRKTRSALVVAATLALCAVCVSLAPLLKLVMMPGGDGGKIQLDVKLPQGKDIESTAAMLKIIEDRIAVYDEIEIVETILGSDSGTNKNVNLAYMNVNLVRRKNRAMSNAVFADRLLPALADLPGVDIRISTVPELGSIAGGGIDFYLKGADMRVLQEKAEAMKKIMDTTEGIKNTALSSNHGKSELVFTPNRKQISEDGLTVQFVAVSLRAAIDGLVATVYKEGGEEYDVRLSISGGTLSDIGDIRNIPIVTARGVYPLSRYADVAFREGTGTIRHSDKTRIIRISADILTGFSSGNMTSRLLRDFGAVELPAGYSLALTGNTKMMANTTRDIITAFLIAVVLVYMLLAAMLESLIEPLFIRLVL
jgi:HAE1 family hydrophobic/amphiphilic exporter-1